jgi:hypothetical protein
MTNLVSCSWSCAFHIWPELRIAAGIEASMMTSLGTWRLVMPRLESTCASAGPRSYVAVIASVIAAGRPRGASPRRTARRRGPGSVGADARELVAYWPKTSAK